MEQIPDSSLWLIILLALMAVFLAAAVLAVIFLAVRVGRAAAQQVEASQQLSEAAERLAAGTEAQLRELERARLPAPQPFVHVGAVTASTTPSGTFFGLEFSLEVTNVGTAAALGLRAHLANQRLHFKPITTPLDLISDEEVATLTFRLSGTTMSAAIPGMPQGVLRLEYRDLFGRRWATITPVAFNVVIEQGLGESCRGLTIHDQREQVCQISDFFIQPDNPVPLRQIDENPRVGCI